MMTYVTLVDGFQDHKENEITMIYTSSNLKCAKSVEITQKIISFFSIMGTFGPSGLTVFYSND